jgi:hypothetical protein
MFSRPSKLESFDRGSEVGAFAPLVGVACGGDCHRRASFWGGAVGGDADVVGPEACQELCRSFSGMHAAGGGACVAWTLARTAGGINGSACELHGAPLPPAAAASAAHDSASRSSVRSHLGHAPGRDNHTDDDSASGPAACDKTSWLAFPDGLAVSPGGHPGWLRQDTEEAAAAAESETDDGGLCYAHGLAYGWASLGAAADAKVLRCRLTL